MSEKTRLVLIGAGGHAAEVLSYVHDVKQSGAEIDLLGVIDDGRPSGRWEGTRILGDTEVLSNLVATSGPLHYIICVGHNPSRMALASRIDLVSGMRPLTLVHPSACVGMNVTIGAGTLVAPAAILTSRLEIGRHCIINAKASLHHDCTVHDFVNINPGATLCGNVKVGSGAFVGAGSTVIEKTSVGCEAIIGAGAVVLSDVPDHALVAGVPARTIKSRTSTECEG